MKTVTLEQFIDFGPCWLYEEGGKERLHKIAKAKQDWSALDILALDTVSVEDRLWAVLREELIDAPVLHKFARRCADEALAVAARVAADATTTATAAAHTAAHAAHAAAHAAHAADAAYAAHAAAYARAAARAAAYAAAHAAYAAAKTAARAADDYDAARAADDYDAARAAARETQLKILKSLL